MKKTTKIKPFSYKVDAKSEVITNPDTHIVRKLSSMKGQYLNSNTY